MLSRVSPFRYLRITGYVLLPEAFRSLSRLSSALSAKASTLCSYLLGSVSARIALRAQILFWFSIVDIPFDISSNIRYLIFCCALYSVFKVQFRLTPEWRQRDSNSRPPACKAGALPTELCPQGSGGHLFFHIVSNEVPSAAYVLTVVFGMGTGVSR